MKPVFFATQDDFRQWLKENYATDTELLVGFYKVGSGKPSMSWSESVDQALCFGWIDGVRKSIDNESYTIRFTPRRSTSIWSAVNIKKVEELKRKCLMLPAGLASYEKRSERRSGIYSHENEAVALRHDLEKKFMANKKAWDFFRKQAPSYQKTCIHLIMNAKQEKTRLSRLERFIEASAAGRKM